MLLVWLGVWVAEGHPHLALWNVWLVALAVCAACDVLSVAEKAIKRRRVMTVAGFLVLGLIEATIALVALLAVGLLGAGVLHLLLLLPH